MLALEVCSVILPFEFSSVTNEVLPRDPLPRKYLIFLATDCCVSRSRSCRRFFLGSIVFFGESFCQILQVLASFCNVIFFHLVIICIPLLQQLIDFL